MPTVAVDLHLLGTSIELAGWWAGRLQLGEHRRIFAGKFERTHTADSYDAGLHKAALLLTRPCLIRLHAPAGYDCPARIGSHKVEHVASTSQGPVFDHLRLVCRTVTALAPLPPGLGGLAAAITISDSVRKVWLTVTLPATADFAHLKTGTEHSSPYRLALAGLAASLPQLPAKPTPLCFLTDNDYVLKGQAGLASWPFNGWVTKGGTPVQNLDLWQAIHEAVEGRPVAWRQLASEQCTKLQALIDAGT
jgi:ribonuclease HI